MIPRSVSTPRGEAARKIPLCLRRGTGLELQVCNPALWATKPGRLAPERFSGHPKPKCENQKVQPGIPVKSGGTKSDLHEVVQVLWKLGMWEALRRTGGLGFGHLRLVTLANAAWIRKPAPTCEDANG